MTPRQDRHASPKSDTKVRKDTVSSQLLGKSCALGRKNTHFPRLARKAHVDLASWRRGRVPAEGGQRDKGGDDGDGFSIILLILFFLHLSTISDIHNIHNTDPVVRAIYPLGKSCFLGLDVVINSIFGLGNS